MGLEASTSEISIGSSHSSTRILPMMLESRANTLQNLCGVGKFGPLGSNEPMNIVSQTRHDAAAEFPKVKGTYRI